MPIGSPIDVVCGVTRIRNRGILEEGTVGPLARVAGGADPRRFLLTCTHVVAPVHRTLETKECEVRNRDGDPWISIGEVLHSSDENDGVDVAVVQLDRTKVRMTSVVGKLGFPRGISNIAAPNIAIKAMCGESGSHPQLSLRNGPGDVTLPHIDDNGDIIEFKYLKHLTAPVFTVAGDSGSAVLNWDNFLLGMVVGATDSDTVIAPFQQLLDFFKTQKSLNLELVV